MKRIFALLAALSLASPALAARPTATPAAHPATRSFAATIPAAALTEVRIGVRVGDVDIRTRATGALKVRVRAAPGGHGHFIFDWTYGQSRGTLPADLHLAAQRRDATLFLCLASRTTGGCAMNLDVPSSGAEGAGARADRAIVVSPFGSKVLSSGQESRDSWESHWVVTLPARLALALNIGVGDADVGGVAGGLTAGIGVGDLDAELPRGPVAADVGVGDIDVRIGSADFGPVDLSAGVGSVAFHVNGKRIARGYEHHVTGADQSLSGAGATAYSLAAGIGDVELTLGVEGLSALPPTAASAPQTAPPATPATPGHPY